MAISAAALCPFGSDAAEMEFTYNVNDDVPMVYGFKKKETYDVAIRIADPTLVGTRVTSMKVDCPVKDGAFENVTAWLSRELKLENKKNVPDICSVEATVSDEWLEVYHHRGGCNLQLCGRIIYGQRHCQSRRACRGYRRVCRCAGDARCHSRDWHISNLFGDRFVSMAYHSQSYESGCMVTLSNDEFPFSVGGFPSGTINRISEMDPCLFPSVWASYAQGMPAADVDAALEWADEKMTRLTAHASARFVRDIKDAGYKLSIALVADGLKNEAWGQSNYYRGKDPDGVESPLWDLFINGQSKVYGLTFNDVVAYYKDVDGIEGSLPAEIVAGDTYTYDYSINVADVVNLKGEQFINPEATVKAVAVIIDANGRPVNCNKPNGIAWDPSGVDTIASGANAVATGYYDLQGRRVANPDKGIFIKVVKLDNGETVRTRVAR